MKIYISKQDLQNVWDGCDLGDAVRVRVYQYPHRDQLPELVEIDVKGFNPKQSSDESVSDPNRYKLAGDVTPAQDDRAKKRVFCRNDACPNLVSWVEMYEPDACPECQTPAAAQDVGTFSPDTKTCNYCGHPTHWCVRCGETQTGHVGKLAVAHCDECRYLDDPTMVKVSSVCSEPSNQTCNCPVCAKKRGDTHDKD